MLISGIGDVHFIEDDMRSVCRDKSKIGAGSGELAERSSKIVCELLQIVFAEQPQRLIHVKAIDDQRRITVARLLSIESDDGAVIIDGRFGAKTPNDARRLHRFGLLIPQRFHGIQA